MKKIIKVKTKKAEIYCDYCGKKINWELQCSVSKCEYCGKDLCEKCIGMEKSTHGDYREVYCKSCWDIAEPYHKKIAEIENKIEDLYNKCEAKCCIKK